MIKERPAKVVMEYYHCDECEAVVKPTGKILTSMPPEVEHVCTGCGKVYPLPTSYPRSAIKEVIEDEVP